VLQQLMQSPPLDEDRSQHSTSSDITDDSELVDTKLRGLYSTLFRLQFSTGSEIWHVTLVLELILVARRPLVGTDIAAALSPDMTTDDVRHTLSELSAYLSFSKDGSASRSRIEDGSSSVDSTFQSSMIRLRHVSFRHWLLDPHKNTSCRVSISRGRTRLAMWHLSQAHSLSRRIFLNEQFPLSQSSSLASSVNDSSEDACSRAMEDILQQEAIYHVLEAAIHLSQLGQLCAASQSVDEGRIVCGLRDLSGPSLIAVDNMGRSALYFAARQGNKDDYLGALRLLIAAAMPRCPSLIIEAGLQSKSPLVVAAKRGHVEALRLLVQAVDDAVQNGSIEPDEAEEELDSALWAAASSGAVACVELLIGTGEDLSIAVERGMIMGATEAAQRDKACPLLDSKGRSALYLAVNQGNAEAVKALLSHSPRTCPDAIRYADIGMLDSDCCDAPSNPLYLAVCQGCSLPRQSRNCAAFGRSRFASNARSSKG